MLNNVLRDALQERATDRGVGQYVFRVEDILGQNYAHPDAAAINAVAGDAVPRRNPDRAHYRAPPSYDEIIGMGADEEEDAGAKKRRKAYVNVGMPWRAEFIELYGHPKDPSECFGCLYRTMRGKLTIPTRDMNVIIELLRNCPAYMATEALAVQVSEKQIEMAQRINATKAFDDPSRIPEWDPATVLDHLETHLMAPALYTRTTFGRLMRYAKWIEEKSLVRVDKHDGDESVDPAQLRCLKEVLTLAQSIAKNSFKDMAFHQPGAVINEERVANLVSQDAFRLFNTLKKRKRAFS